MNISIRSKLQDVQKLRKSNFDVAYSIKRQTGLGNPIPVCFWLSKSPRTFSCLKRKGQLRSFNNEGLHLVLMRQHVTEECHLIACPDKIVLRIGDLVIGVTVDIVCEETYSLHEREQGGSIWQIVPFYRCKEGRG